MCKTLEQLLSDAGACGFGVCSYGEELAIKGVRSYKRIPYGAKSIIVCLFPYLTPNSRGGNVALYAMLPDYHRIVGRMLNESVQNLKGEYPNNQFVEFVDSSPIKEVKAAVRAGLGAFGKNGLLITEKYGTLTFIGTIVTDFAFEHSDCNEKCSQCQSCIKACPTGALGENGINRSLCRSDISQKKGELSDWEKLQIKQGKLVWGCDICSLACPKSKTAEITPIKDFLENVTPVINDDNLDRIFPQSAFEWRGKDVIKRNISIVEGKGV